MDSSVFLHYPRFNYLFLASGDVMATLGIIACLCLCQAQKRVKLCLLVFKHLCWLSAMISRTFEISGQK